MLRNSMSDELRRLSAEPSTDADWIRWLDPRHLAATLKGLSEGEEIILYAGLPSVFVHTVGVPSERLDRPDSAYLLQWNIGAHDGSWSAVFGFHPPAVRVDPPLTHTSTATLERGSKLIYPRSFEGLIGDKHYFELEQAFTHLMALHYVTERRAWCRLDERGDVAELVRIVQIPANTYGRDGTVVLAARPILDEWMAITQSALVQMFDMTRMGRRQLARSEIGEMEAVVDGDCIYKFRNDDDAVVVRGVNVIRSRMTTDALFARTGLSGVTTDERRYAAFIAYDFRRGELATISTAPGATANYVEESSLPFEMSPAFFRPEVLLRYKQDSDKYRIRHRSIGCRGAWHLQTFDMNEAGQVFTYLCYLSRLPYEEQLYWKAHNEEPKAPISKRALKTDFEGAFFVDEPDPLEQLKQRLDDWYRRRVEWWTLRAEKLPDRCQYPVTSSADEWADEIMNLHQLLVEGFEETRLRARVAALGSMPEPRWRSLKLLEACLVAWRFDEERARKITAPFHQLHELRIKVKGHAPGTEADALKREAVAEHRSYQRHFEAVCAACAESVEVIDQVFSAEWPARKR
jgi:hypothetical protein